MKVLRMVLIFLIALLISFENVFSKNIEVNPPTPYFEMEAYTLGRVYAITKDKHLLAQYEELFSKDNTFCIVLMYHNIYKDKKINSYDVSVEDFKKHIQILKKYGFESISLDDLYAFLKFNKRIPKRSVIFTFDDGFKSVLLASAILKENGFSGVSSIIVGYIGSNWEVSSSEIKSLLKNGFEVSLHSYKLHNTYLKLLKEKKYSEIEKDIKASKDTFISNFNITPIAFTYPQGAYDEHIKKILEKYNFKIGFGLDKKIVNRYKDDPFYVSRIEISERLGYANPKRFEALIKEILKED